MTTVQNFGEMDKAIMVRSLMKTIENLSKSINELYVVADMIEDIVIESEEGPDGKTIVRQQR